MRMLALVLSAACAFGHGDVTLAEAQISGSTCAKVTTAGETCEELKAGFDLSECPKKSASILYARVRCGSNGEVAEIEGKRGGRRYRATLEREDRGYQGFYWNVASIRETGASGADSESQELADETPAEPVKVAGETPVRTLRETVPEPAKESKPKPVKQAPVKQAKVEHVKAEPPRNAALETAKAVVRPEPVKQGGKKSGDLFSWIARSLFSSESAKEPARQGTAKEASREPAKESTPVSPQPAPEGAAAPSVTSTPTAPAAQGGLALSGQVDFYYAFNFNRPAPPSSGSGSVPASNRFRYYDFRHNQLSLSLLELTLKKTGSEFGFVMDLDFGETADANAAGDEAIKHVGQAVVSYTPAGAPRLSFSAGKMLSHIGLETMKARENWQYSRSATFGGLPVWHLGVQAGYAIAPGTLVINGYFYNGTGASYDTNSGKTLGGQLRFTPSDNLTLVYNAIGGPERAADNSSLRSFHELNAVWTASQSLALALELMAASEKGAAAGGADAAWRGASLAAKWSVSESYALSPRIELYRDAHGATLGSAQTLHGYTLTNSFDLGGGLETRLEFRHDRSVGATPFESKTGPESAQTTVLWGVLLGF